jgi:hypothetical protein
MATPCPSSKPTLYPKPTFENFLLMTDGKRSTPTIQEQAMLGHLALIRYIEWLALIRKQERLKNSVIADLAHYVALQHVRTPTALSHTEELGKQALIEATNEQWAKLLDDDERRRVLAEMEQAHPEATADARETNPDGELLTKQDSGHYRRQGL